MTGDVVPKKKKRSFKISFEEESVPKHLAEERLSQENPKSDSGKKKQKKPKKKVTQLNEFVSETSNGDVEKTVKKKKRKLKQIISEDALQTSSNASNDNEVDTTNSSEKPLKKKRKEVEASTDKINDQTTKSDSKKTESIRERKRKKYAKLLEEKKLQTELALQEKSLNYLSKWKHTPNEWKFEKLRQIWLKQNMYDSDKVPQTFWEILVLYFGNAKGRVKDVILKEALKIIEEEEQQDDQKQEDTESENNCRKARARDIIQNLQE